MGRATSKIGSLSIQDFRRTRARPLPVAHGLNFFVRDFCLGLCSCFCLPNASCPLRCRPARPSVQQACVPADSRATSEEKVRIVLVCARSFRQSIASSIVNGDALDQHTHEPRIVSQFRVRYEADACPHGDDLAHGLPPLGFDREAKIERLDRAWQIPRFCGASLNRSPCRQGDNVRAGRD